VNAAIAAERLRNQHITGAGRRQPADVVAWLGVVQAQEYPAARWGLALRMQRASTDAEISRAVDAGRILRTHALRPTWHFVTPADIRWILELTGPRVLRVISHYKRRSGLDARTCTRATAIFERALRVGHHRTRAELGAQLARARIAAKGISLALLTMHAELEGIICSGRRRDTQLTYALLAERAPRARRLSPEESLAELTGRFFRSHGPATIRDFVWWSGLTAVDAKRGLEMNRARPQVADGQTYWTVGRDAPEETRRELVHLLPVYDEYLVAYRDRHAVPHATAALRSKLGGPTIFQHPIIIDGQVAGTWKTTRGANGHAVTVASIEPLGTRERRGLDDAVTRYTRFLGADVTVTTTA
jgi:hypothetical protein